MLGNLFLNADTKVALSELDRALRGEHGLAFSLIKPEIETLLKQRKGKLAPEMRARGLSHEVMILLVAKWILDSELSSGRHHIYRGVLSQSGDALWSLYQYTVGKTWAVIPRQDVTSEEDIEAMKAKIAKVG